MTSITSATSNSQQFSPLQRLQDELASEVASGTVSSGDQSALSTALTDIDTAMKSQAPTAGSPPSQGSMKSKIDGLIANEVSNGTLTSGQATELQNVFAKAFKGGPGGPGGPGGAHGHHHDADGNNGSGGTSNTSSAQSSTSSDTTQLLQDFLKMIQDSQGNSSTSYGSGGDNLSSQIQSLIVNFQT